MAYYRMIQLNDIYQLMWSHCRLNSLIFLLIIIQFIVDSVCHQSQQIKIHPTYRYLIFTEKCYDTFFIHNNWLDKQCLKFTLSKILGYGIVVGAAIVKLPQIIKIVKRKSVFGVSFSSAVYEELNVLLAIAYSIYHQNPFSVYGETVLIAIQMLVIMVLFLIYDDKNKFYYSFMTVLMICCFWCSYHPEYFPQSILESSIIIQTILFALARMLQIVEVHRIKSVGSLSIITVGLSVLGNITRLATVLIQIGEDTKFAINVITAFLLNGYLFLLFFIFSDKKQKELVKED